LQRGAEPLAANKIAVMSCHFPRPGYGHVVKIGEGFHDIAEPMKMVLRTKPRSGGGVGLSPEAHSTEIGALRGPPLRGRGRSLAGIDVDDHLAKKTWMPLRGDRRGRHVHLLRITMESPLG
jgi:hypothetical protein